MNKRKKIYSVFSFLLAGTLCLSMAACGGTPTPAEDETTSSAPLSGALPVKALQPKHVDENPYMAKSDANIHHDGYNTDSTDEILPLGIYPEINVSFETTNPNASPAIYFDNYGHAVVPLLGGIAIRDLNATETKTLGYFSPMQHDGGGYVIQSSYTFLDSKNRVVCPTSNNHVLILRRKPLVRHRRLPNLSRAAAAGCSRLHCPHSDRIDSEWRTNRSFKGCLCLRAAPWRGRRKRHCCLQRRCGHSDEPELLSVARGRRCERCVVHAI